MGRYLAGFAFVLAACGGHSGGGIDKFIGAQCNNNGQCDHTCFTGGDYPAGFCSIGCASDNDCPTDTYCTTKSGGVCLYVCPPFDCGRLGPGWGCHEVDHVGGGKVDVCIGN